MGVIEKFRKKLSSINIGTDTLYVKILMGQHKFTRQYLKLIADLEIRKDQIDTQQRVNSLIDGEVFVMVPENINDYYDADPEVIQIREELVESGELHEFLAAAIKAFNHRIPNEKDKMIDRLRRLLLKAGTKLELFDDITGYLFSDAAKENLVRVIKEEEEEAVA